jgi:uncharacterized protein
MNSGQVGKPAHTFNCMLSLKERIEKIDWKLIAAELERSGYALSPPLLKPAECKDLIELYENDQIFRSRVVMERHNFGRGQYRYFADPLPQTVLELREYFYPPLAEIANGWMPRLQQSLRFPPKLSEFIAHCHRHEQTKPTPLLLRYEIDDYNCLHQDLYGEVAFPIQVACLLNLPGRDFTGGEFLLAEQRPRAQTRAEAITIDRGQFIIFPNRWRPVSGTREDYRVNMRHGVSRLRSGMRYCLGIIFHDAE